VSKLADVYLVYNIPIFNLLFFMKLHSILKFFSVQKFAFLYTLLFTFLVAMNYMPFLYADNGLMFGFFKLEPAANILHLLSGIWAGFAAWRSRSASLFYFRVFGTAYFLDGVVGVLAGKAYLNFNIFNHHTQPVADMMTRLVLNTPHLVIGGSAMIIGFVLYKYLSK
jgi:hypothetical protein